MYSEQHTRRLLCFNASNPKSIDTAQRVVQLSIAITGVTPPTPATLARFQTYYENRPVRQSLDGKVLLFYNYCDILEPHKLLEWQKTLTKLLRLRGRVHVGLEGINGTVGGSREAVALYMSALQTHSVWSRHFANTDMKLSSGGHHCFPNMYVRLCTEICQMNASPEKITWRDQCHHLTPLEFHEQIKSIGSTSTRNDSSDSSDSSGSNGSSSHADSVLLDVRNHYESEVGQFDGAVRLPTRHFTDFPKVIDTLIETMQLREKKVYMYCTGGIRCERASAYMRSKGVKECYQLSGGIHKYTVELGDQTLFRGKNFVFDRRLLTERVGTTVPIGACIVCRSRFDVYDKKISCAKCACLVLVCLKCRGGGGGAGTKVMCAICCSSSGV